jgi:hypothetical protein
VSAASRPTHLDTTPDLRRRDWLCRVASYRRITPGRRSVTDNSRTTPVNGPRFSPSVTEVRASHQGRTRLRSRSIPLSSVIPGGGELNPPRIAGASHRAPRVPVDLGGQRRRHPGSVVRAHFDLGDPFGLRPGDPCPTASAAATASTPTMTARKSGSRVCSMCGASTPGRRRAGGWWESHPEGPTSGQRPSRAPVRTEKVNNSWWRIWADPLSLMSEVRVSTGRLITLLYVVVSAEW